MTSPAPETNLATVAAALCPDPVTSVRLLRDGGNSRIFLVEAAASRYVLKAYPRYPGDHRDRLGQEFAALSCLADVDPQRRTPRPIACDRQRGYALYEFIAGERPERTTVDDIDQITDFVETLYHLRGHPLAASLAPASEATMSLDDIAGQIEGRAARLAAMAAHHAALADFLSAAFRPVAERAMERAECLYAAAGLSRSSVLPAASQTLSPSDFGFHNMLRRPDNRLVFLDFEYFGWDDPVRLTADFDWHPAMCLDLGQRQRFYAGTSRLFGADPAYATRLTALWPLVGLRWCMILLNAFLPGRSHAPGMEASETARSEILAHQLVKAQTALQRVDSSLKSNALPIEGRHGGA